MQPFDFAAAGTEVLVGILGVDTALNDVAVGEDAVLGSCQLCAGGDPDLPLNDVKTGDHLGNAVLDLQTCIHFHKVEVVVHVEQELNGARVYVVDSLSRLDRGDHHLLSGFFVERGTGTFLDHLLVLALNRALSLAEADSVAILVGEKLHLDVLDGVDKLLEVARAVAERRLSLGGRREERVLELLERIYPADTLAAAARTGFDQQRKADSFGLCLGDRDVLNDVAAGSNGHARGAHGFARNVLVAEHCDHRRGGAYKVDIALLAERHELRVLAEQTVAGVDRLGAALDRDGEDRGNVEIAVSYAAAAHAIALVGELNVHGVAVCLGVDGDGGNAHLTAGADNTHRNLAAVGNQNFRKHFINLWIWFIFRWERARSSAQPKRRACRRRSPWRR